MSSAAQGRRPEADMSDAELLAKATERPWYFDGWDIFTAGSSAGPRGDGHRLVVPLSHLDNTFHPSQRVSRYDAELIVRAVNAYVGR